jgi:hypothetical protein
MDTLEIPRFELMNYLPYSLIEEALEYDLCDLSTLRSSSKRSESRITSYLKQNQLSPECKLETLITSFDFEKEVSEEINKILQSKSLYDALFNSFIDTNSLNNLLQDAIGKENIKPSLIN